MRMESIKVRYNKDFETADLSNEEFDDIFMKVETLIERIEMIEPHLNRYRKEKLDFSQLVDLIHGVHILTCRRELAYQPLARR